ncbi:hypothetical protein IC229_05795 [Spirosoma sp. BT702]|uniref:Uncharacterized protein n=1 Tax=Spirosoma profusum TaxID=2771354 RepID=A0A927AQC7_9BACT|nr:hypothetical protein [Spirosoma profusum]MBD2700138.1 hypothetical protein [Spirosoma profusum]
MTHSITQLQAWLDRPVYTQGVVLYESLLGEGFLLTLFKTGDDAYNRGKLQDALEAHLAQLLQQQADQKAAYPDTLKSQLSSAGQLMDERTLLKERLRVLFNSGVGQSDDAKALAFRILGITDQLDAIYGEQHFFEQHGFLPDAASAQLPESDTLADLLKRRNSVRTYVTKYQKELANTFEPARRKKVTRRLEGFLTELQQLNTQIALLNPS